VVVAGRSLAAVVDVGTGRSVVVEPTLLLLVLLLCLATFRFLSFPFFVFFNPDNMFCNISDHCNYVHIQFHHLQLLRSHKHQLLLAMLLNVFKFLNCRKI